MKLIDLNMNQKISQKLQKIEEIDAKYFCHRKQRYCIISAHSVGECPFHMYSSMYDVSGDL